MRPRSTCTRVMGREEYGEGKELLMILRHTTSSVSMVVVVSWRGHVWLPVELVLLLFIDDVTADKSSRMNSEVFRQYYLLIFSQMLQNSLDGASQCRWTMTQSILQKQPKSFWRERSGLLCNGQVHPPDLNPIEHAFHLLKTKTWREMPKNKAGTEDGCSRGLAEHHQGWNPASGDVYAFQTSGCNWLQRICNQVLKSESLISWLLFCPITFWSLNSGSTYANCCNSYTVHLIWM